MKPIHLLLCLALVSCRSGTPSSAPFARGALQTFEMVERFGISHPDQIVFFDLRRRVDASRVAVVDEAGNRVPFQIMTDGRLALRTDLPANATRKWALVKVMGDEGANAISGDRHHRTRHKQHVLLKVHTVSLASQRLCV